MSYRKPVLVLATNNRHKVREIKAILRRSRLKITIRTLLDFPKQKPVVEDKPTLEGNAAKKAREIAKAFGYPALADDTGLFIPALRGRPGVVSARFAGPRCNYEDNNRKVLKLMRNIPMKQRRALFRCVAVLAVPSGKSWGVEGRIVGKIAFEPKGSQGFGYDPIFIVPRHGLTFAQMKTELKNKVSHRARAFKKVPRLLRRVFS